MYRGNARRSGWFSAMRNPVNEGSLHEGVSFDHIVPSNFRVASTTRSISVYSGTVRQIDLEFVPPFPQPSDDGC